MDVSPLFSLYVRVVELFGLELIGRISYVQVIIINEEDTN